MLGGGGRWVPILIQDIFVHVMPPTRCPFHKTHHIRRNTVAAVAAVAAAGGGGVSINAQDRSCQLKQHGQRCRWIHHHMVPQVFNVSVIVGETSSGSPTFQKQDHGSFLFVGFFLLLVLGDFRQIRPGFCIKVGLYRGGGRRGEGAIQHLSPYSGDRWQIGHHRQLFPFSRACVAPHRVVVVGGGDVLQQDLVPIHGRLLHVQTTTATSIQPMN